MKRLLIVASTAALFASTLGATELERPVHAAKALNVLYYVDGTLGDKSFFDSGEAGVLRAQKAFGIAVKTFQEPDTSRYQTDLVQFSASHKYDIIIAGTSTLHDQVQAVARQFPHQIYVYYDDVQPGMNIVSVKYLQNESSFLAGALAALVVDSRMPLVSGHKTIAMVGGQDIPVINDFYVGYAQGAAYVDPAIKVLKSYIGGAGGNDTWANPSRGSALTKVLYSQGADVVFAVAGGSGLGVLKQSLTSNRYSIGVDSNQNFLYPGHVLTSVVKRVDNSFFDLLGLAVKGSLHGGRTYLYGLKNQGVGIVEDSYYKRLVAPALQARMRVIDAAVAAGKVKVKSAYSS